MTQTLPPPIPAVAPGPGPADAAHPFRPMDASGRDLDCEICVIGDDIAGLVIAADLASRGHEVVLLTVEGAPGLGLSAALSSGFALPVSEMVARVGVEDARELMGLSIAAAERGKRYATEAGVALGPKGRLAVARPHAAARLAAEQEARCALIADSAMAIDAADTEALLGTRAFTAAFGMVPAQRVDAAAFRAVLLEAARESGVRVLAAPTELSSDVHGLRKYVRTPKGRVRAFQLVFSGGLALRWMAPAIAASLMATPHVRGCFHVPGLDVAYQGLVEEFGATGLRFHWDGAHVTAVAETATRVWSRGGAARVLRRHLEPVYGAVDGRLADAARGVMTARLSEGMPLVYEGEKGVWYCATLGDEEPAYGLLAADLIVGAIAERDDRVRLLQPFGPAARQRRPSGRLAAIAAYGYAFLSARLPALTAFGWPASASDPASASRLPGAAGAGQAPALPPHRLASARQGSPAAAEPPRHAVPVMVRAERSSRGALSAHQD